MISKPPNKTTKNSILEPILTILCSTTIFLIISIALATHSNNSPIVGKWQQDNQNIYEFHAGNTFTKTTVNGRSEMGFWHVNKNRLTISNLITGERKIIDYRISDDILIFKNNGELSMVLIRVHK